jgi:hypothetical protein
MSAAATIRERASAARDDWVFVIAARRYRHLAESEDLVTYAASRIDLVS